MLEARHHRRLAAYAAHPERFVQGPPRLEILPHAVWINPPANTTDPDAPANDDRHPARPAAGEIRGPQLVISDPQLSTMNSLESLQ